MKRCFEMGAWLALLGALSGCSACQSPFDYCGPVDQANGCHSCNFGARRGSIYAPVDGIPATTTEGPAPGIGTDPGRRVEPVAEPLEATPVPTPTPEPEPRTSEPRTTELDNGDRLE